MCDPSILVLIITIRYLLILGILDIGIVLLLEKLLCLIHSSEMKHPEDKRKTVNQCHTIR